MIKVSIYDRNLDMYFIQDLQEVINEIKNGRYKILVKEIRNLMAAGKREQAESAMKKLPWFLISGIFDEDPDEEAIKEYSGYITLELEEIDYKNVQELIQKIESIATTYSWFQSLDENRITIIVPVNSDVYSHEVAYSQVADYYESIIGKKVDRIFQRITKPCYFSYCPQLFLNPNCKEFAVLLDDKLADSYS